MYCSRKAKRQTCATWKVYFIYTCAGGKRCQKRYFTTLVSQTQLLHRQLLLFLLTAYNDFSVITRSTGTLNTATAAVFAEEQVQSGRDENMHYGLANAIDCSRPDCCRRRRGSGTCWAWRTRAALLSVLAAACRHTSIRWAQSSLMTAGKQRHRRRTNAWAMAASQSKERSGLREEGRIRSNVQSTALHHRAWRFLAPQAQLRSHSCSFCLLFSFFNFSRFIKY